MAYLWMPAAKQPCGYLTFQSILKAAFSPLSTLRHRSFVEKQLIHQHNTFKPTYFLGWWFQSLSLSPSTEFGTFPQLADRKAKSTDTGGGSVLSLGRTLQKAQLNPVIYLFIYLLKGLEDLRVEARGEGSSYYFCLVHA